LGKILQELFAETTNNSSDGQHDHTNCDTILVDAPVDFQGVDKEPNYETTHQNNNSEATPDSHIASVIQGDTDGGIPFFVEKLGIYSEGELISDANRVSTGGSVPVTPPARALLKRPALAPKDSEASESSPKKTRETRDAPDIESETPLQRPPVIMRAAPATNTGSILNTITDTDSTSTSVTEPITNITIQINTDTGSSPNRKPGADPKGPQRCKEYREREKVKKEKQNEDLRICLEKQRKLKAVEAYLKNPGSSAARDAVSNSEPLEIGILDEPCGSNNNDNIIYIDTKSALMEASQKITKAAKWRSSLEVDGKFDEFEFKFDVEPPQPSDEKIVKERKSVRNSREKFKAVKDLKVQMMKTLKEKNIPTLEAKIKQLQQDQALLGQQHQQHFQQNTGSPTQVQQPQSQPKPQQQVQALQSGASGGVQTIGVNQQQPQVIQLQPQQQKQHAQTEQQMQQPEVIQLQPQQQQQMQQLGAAGGPPGGIQIVQQIITPTGEIHQIPIQLNAQQLQMIRAQAMGGAGSSLPIVIQTPPIQAQLAQPVQTVQTIQLQGGQHVYYLQQ